MGDTYHWLFTELSDPRTYHFPLVNGPITPLFFVLSYIYLIKIWLPKWMEDRAPYDLKTTINIYNTFQIVVNAYVVYAAVKSGAMKVFNINYLYVDESTDSDTYTILYCMWTYYVLKIIEFADTIFFVLRKKNNQASFLHIYHHASTYLFSWLGMNYAPGGVFIVVLLLNSFVHSVMYTYYLISAIASAETRKKLDTLKKYITSLQMIQFSIIILYHLIALFDTSCSFPKFLAFLLIFEVAFIFFLFIGFYSKTYNSNKKLLMKTG